MLAKHSRLLANKQIVYALRAARAAIRIAGAFISHIPNAVWKEMTFAQRSAHKILQAEFKTRKFKKRLRLALGKYPRHYKSTHRKTKLQNATPVSAVDRITAEAIKENIKLVKQWGINVNSVHGLMPNKCVYWNFYLPAYYVLLNTNTKFVVETRTHTYLISEFGVIEISKEKYGALFILDTRPKSAIKYRLGDREIFEFSNAIMVDDTCLALKENVIIGVYSKLVKWPRAVIRATRRNKIKLRSTESIKNHHLEKRGYIKHVVRMRYRWVFRSKLSKFKRFKKFFKRSLKRYRKISKNRLFISRFRKYFTKLTGFTEKGLLKLWLPFRRNYNQYWSTNNAVVRFSQSLLLRPINLLVFLRLSPSFAASKYITKSGAVSINGLAITTFAQFRPGDIMQLNFVIWKTVRQFFDYQRWNNDLRLLQHVPFLQVDWSSLMFMLIRWPKKYELTAPNFLSERWIRYYVRQFPSKIRNFKKADGNWKIYKRIIAKY